jgi:hypothetical protein
MKSCLYYSVHKQSRSEAKLGMHDQTVLLRTYRRNVLPSLRGERREDVGLLSQWLGEMVGHLSSHEARRVAGTEGLCMVKCSLLCA